MASLPGAVMKKSSGYGSAFSLARAISVSARAGTAALSAAAAASHTASGRWRRRCAPDRCPYRSAGSVWPAASRRRQLRRRSAHLRNGTAGSPASPRFSTTPPAGRRGLWRRRSAASAGSGACSMIFVTSPPAGSSYPPPPAGRPRCSRGSVSASKPRRRRRRFQTARCARRGGQSAARRSPPGWRRCRWGFTTGARAAACRRLTLAETKKSKGEQYGVGNSIVT